MNLSDPLTIGDKVKDSRFGGEGPIMDVQRILPNGLMVICSWIEEGRFRRNNYPKEVLEKV